MRTFLQVLILSGLCLAQTGNTSGIDRSALDTTCKPCDDFWRYANGTYIDKHPIPAQYARWGTFTILRDGNAERMKVILESAAANPAATGNEKIVGSFYASCMNTAAIDALGAKPIEPELKQFAAIQTREQLKAALLSLEREGSVNPVPIGGQPDLTNANQVIAGVRNGGLSLPDRDYYVREDEKSRGIRAEFLKYAAKMFVLLGDAPAVASSEAATVLDFETVFAKATLTNVESRDPYKRFHKMNLAGLKELAPDYDWNAVFASLNIADTIPVNVAQPDFVKAFDRQLTSAPIETWKIWLRWRVADSQAPYLAKTFNDEWFHFHRAVLTGVTQPQPRWQTCSLEADSRLGDALGRLFVEKHFPAEAKRRMNELVENLRASLRGELENATWLEADTRRNAVRKLSSFEAHIGYPEKWRDFANVKVDRGAYLNTVESVKLENRRYTLSKIGQKVDRAEMGMTPPTVNASYSPPSNIITFPAGILQPPFFTMDADDAVNYGAIGAVIGHEMGHGFDDQGSKYDADGNLKNWWTDQDRAKFEVRAGCVTNQFEGLEHNGKLVTGEAMGDLGGLTVAYKAYHRSLNGKEAPVIDGFTGDQRFFLAFARVWADQSRPEQERLQLATDPHPLSKNRANATLQNMPEFHKAFGCKQGDAMVRPADQQCKLLVEKIAELQERGYCVLKGGFSDVSIRRCREAFWPVLLEYIGSHSPNRGDHRYFVPMPFSPPCFAAEFFFDAAVLAIVRGIMGDRIVADQWGCDAPLKGSAYQEVHADYKRPLFEEAPELNVPVYMLVVSFGLADIGLDDGPIEIAPGTHRIQERGTINLEPVTLDVGDVLIRHPWALHRGTPNITETPRALLTIRYVRRWYTDASREVCAIPALVWQSLTAEQQSMMRFPVEAA